MLRESGTEYTPHYEGNPEDVLVGLGDTRMWTIVIPQRNSPGTLVNYQATNFLWDDPSVKTVKYMGLQEKYPSCKENLEQNIPHITKETQKMSWLDLETLGSGRL